MEQPSCPGCRERDARIAALEARVAELEALVHEQARLLADLARKLQDKDLPTAGARPQAPAAPPPAQKASGRKPGGQPGHPPHLKQLLPPERVSATRLLVPVRCEHCRAPLPAQRGPDDPPPVRLQVAELPDVR